MTYRYEDSARPLALCLALALAGYFFCLIWPLQMVTTVFANATVGVTSAIRTWQLAGAGLLVAACGVGVATRTMKFMAPSLPLMLAWLFTILWFLVTSAWSLAPSTSATYAAVLLVMLISSALFWTLPAKAIRFGSAACICVTTALIALLATKLEIHTRNLGGITPNVMGHIGLSLLVVGHLGGRFWRIVGVAIGAGLLFFAQSRTAFIAAAGFLALFYVVMPTIRSPQSLIRAAGVVVGVGFLVAILAGPAIELSSGLSSKLLGVQETVRTTDSFSGRSQSWDNGFEALQGRELTGYGFRTRGSLRLSEAGLSVNAHSGLLNAALDVGLIGLFLFLVTYLLSVWAAAKAWGENRKAPDRCAAAFLLAMIPVLVVEPNYLNFAASSHFLMLLFLAKSLFSFPKAKTLPAKRGATTWSHNHTMGYQPMHRSNER